MYELVLDQPVYQCTLGGWKQRIMQNLDSCSPFMAKHVLVISIFQGFSVNLSIVIKKCQNRNKKTKTEIVSHESKMWIFRLATGKGLIFQIPLNTIKIFIHIDGGPRSVHTRPSTQPPFKWLKIFFQIFPQSEKLHQVFQNPRTTFKNIPYYSIVQYGGYVGVPNFF